MWSLIPIGAGIGGTICLHFFQKAIFPGKLNAWSDSVVMFFDSSVVPKL